MNQTISILGCGWYGLPLAEALVNLGYQVKGSTTNPIKIEVLRKKGIQPFIINLQKENSTLDANFFNCDILLICIPPKRSSGEQADYPIKIDKIRAAAAGKSSKVIFISSTSVYGENNHAIDELSTTAPETASGLSMVEAENLLIDDENLQTTVIRFAGLVGPGRNPGRFFAGKTNIPNGQAPVNLIHLTDCIQISLAIIAQSAFGYLFNACCPDHPQKQQFYAKAASQAGLAPPQFVDELQSWKIINSKNTSKILNYKYVIDNWSDWLGQD